MNEAINKPDNQIVLYSKLFHTLFLYKEPNFNHFL